MLKKEDHDLLNHKRISITFKTKNAIERLHGSHTHWQVVTCMVEGCDYREQTEPPVPSYYNSKVVQPKMRGM